MERKESKLEQTFAFSNNTSPVPDEKNKGRESRRVDRWSHRINETESKKTIPLLVVVVVVSLSFLVRSGDAQGQQAAHSQRRDDRQEPAFED